MIESPLGSESAYAANLAGVASGAFTAYESISQIFGSNLSPQTSIAGNSFSLVVDASTLNLGLVVSDLDGLDNATQVLSSEGSTEDTTDPEK